MASILDRMASDTAAQIGAALREVRRDRKLSQAELAAAAGTARMTVSRIENGQRTGQIAQLKAFANVLEIDYRDLLPSDSSDDGSDQ
jgi:transcriptional regulator with XRE-family HTH domain